MRYIRYKVIEELVNKGHGFLVNWKFVSKHCSKEFYINHKDDKNYKFDHCIAQRENHNVQRKSPEKFSLELLEDILDSKKNVRLLDDLQELIPYETINNHPRKYELLDKILKYNSEQSRMSPELTQLLLYISDIEYIKKNVKGFSSYMQSIFERKEADFELVKIMCEEYMVASVPWKIVTRKPWATDELILQNFHMPWDIYDEYT